MRRIGIIGHVGLGLALAACLLAEAPVIHRMAAPADVEVKWQIEEAPLTPKPAQRTPMQPGNTDTLLQLLFHRKRELRAVRKPGWFAKSKRRYNRRAHRALMNGWR